MTSFPKTSYIWRNQVRRPRAWFQSGGPCIYNYFSEYNDLHLVEKLHIINFISYMKFPAPMLSGTNWDIAIRPRGRTRDNKQHCHNIAECEFIEGQHQGKCPMLPLLCPNKCKVGSVPRKKMAKHRKECQLEGISCSNGCGLKLERHLLSVHVETECPPDKQTASCNSPYDWLMSMAMDLRSCFVWYVCGGKNGII